jgi:hypothetical protein
MLKSFIKSQIELTENIIYANKNARTIRAVISQSPKAFACDNFMSKFRNSKREISLI